MSDSLRVIALISGGKDSFFSLLHCLQNGHQVVALGNLYPPPPHVHADHAAEGDDERDLNSFMYQTVGHEVIPLYAQALGIPLYRQQIVGGAVQTGTSYKFAGVAANGRAVVEAATGEDEEDETESLVPLLKSIMAAHPGANALSTGAILSTYQRTRVESVALRLGLTPLSYLWQYPILPPGMQISLLEDMQVAGLDARIVKVASGGLDESFLWQNVASTQVMRRVEKAMKRFGTDGDGAVLGEGGEFETLVVDGPPSLFKGRIEILEEDRKVIREGGGSAWLKIVKARVVMKELGEAMQVICRTPDLLEPRFTKILEALGGEEKVNSSLESRISFATPNSSPFLHSLTLLSQQAIQNNILHWTFTAEQSYQDESVTAQASKAIDAIRTRLHHASLDPISIISTVIILRSMQDFASINKVYGALFTAPNPPSRITISCGTLLPASTTMIIHLTLQSSPPMATFLSARRALHVQSRSYWAPANIGPYSQAVSIPLLNSSSSPSSQPLSRVSIAGQIPLVPHTMAFPHSTDTDTALQNFTLETTLSLQHLHRIAREMHVSWFSSAVAFLPSFLSSSSPSSSPSSTPSPLLLLPQKARLLSRAWTLLHAPPNTDDSASDAEEDERDLWEEKNYAGMEVRGGLKDERLLPDFEVVTHQTASEVHCIPPFWAVEVEALPRDAGVEWSTHIGITGGPIQVITKRSSEDGWTVHQCAFGDTVITVLMLAYSSSLKDLRGCASQGFEALDVEEWAEEKSFAAYVDVGINGIWGERKVGGGVPCRSIWDGEGERLAAVLVFDCF